MCVVQFAKLVWRDAFAKLALLVHAAPPVKLDLPAHGELLAKPVLLARAVPQAKQGLPGHGELQVKPVLPVHEDLLA